ncbi:MAG: hypothetical protein PHD63_05735 [Candidatus Marinimicrobia bacterium]|jgi:hypothetical protein|nr:hypothetical protein [Candidatus Neomarinimicrobiota bacterium]MDD3967053.1 hypothetical protein [Candidatus Neomarinimicrobiota bacterium]
MVNESEIEIPCIIKVRLYKFHGYHGPAEPIDDDPPGKYDIHNDDLIVQKIKEDILSLKPSNFDGCLQRQFSKNPGDRGFLVETYTNDDKTLETYEADLWGIHIYPLTVSTKLEAKTE